MTIRLELEKVTPLEEFAGDEPAETAIVREMAARADRYIMSFDWCAPISARYVGVGIGSVLGLFLYRFERPINDTDEYLWVVEGDLPSAYFVVDEAPDPASALDVYCGMMDDWIAAVEGNKPLVNVFPVGAPAIKNNAEMLRSRVQFIRDRILPTL